MKKKSLAPKPDLFDIKTKLDHDLCHSLDPHHFQRIKKSVIILNGPAIGYEIHMRDGKVLAAAVPQETHAMLVKKLAPLVKSHCTPKNPTAKKPVIKLS